MVVLPEGLDDTKASWDALDSVGLDPERVVAVAVHGVPYVPDRYASRILSAAPSGLLRLPSAADRAAAWDAGPDVAINLLPPRDPSGALLVGASPAAIRVGYADRRAEPFYDLLIGAPGEARPGPAAVARMLLQVDPTLFRPS